MALNVFSEFPSQQVLHVNCERIPAWLDHALAQSLARRGNPQINGGTHCANCLHLEEACDGRAGVDQCCEEGHTQGQLSLRLNSLLIYNVLWPAETTLMDKEGSLFSDSSWPCTDLLSLWRRDGFLPWMWLQIFSLFFHGTKATWLIQQASNRLMTWRIKC